MRRLKGTVVSDKMQKTVVVRVDRLKKHSKYQKYYRLSTKFKAHNPDDYYKTGDVVIIEETRPISKDKRWKVVELVERRESDLDISPTEESQLIGEKIQDGSTELTEKADQVNGQQSEIESKGIKKENHSKSN